MEQVPLAVIKQQLGLPDSAECLGYVIHLPDSDEFLAAIGSTEAATARAFVQTPEAAKLYSDFNEAKADAKQCSQKAEVGLLFDAGDQYFYASPGE